MQRKNLPGWAIILILFLSAGILGSSGAVASEPPVAVVRVERPVVIASPVACPPVANVRVDPSPVFLPEASTPTTYAPVPASTVYGTVSNAAYTAPVSTQVIAGWNRVHSHQCGRCGTTWSHTDNSFGSATDHNCPRCGSGPYYTQVAGSSRTVPIYRNVQQPTPIVQQATQQMPVRYQPQYTLSQPQYLLKSNCPGGNCPIR